LLPAIQREVVWGCDRIEKLFDSIMRDYPFGSLLFWRVERKSSGDYQFYEFMRDYSELDNTHNSKASVNGQEDITGVLDGQQRLTALYVGLKGSYAYKEPRKRWDNAAAFPKRKLYLNLLSKAPDDRDGLEFDFQFLTDEEASVSDQETFWFRVGDVLDMKDHFQVNDFLIKRNLMALGERSQLANRMLFKLRQAVHDAPLINYFLERDGSLDKVLQIFIRVNSGGVPLNYSDLLLSVATAQWKQRDAREEVYQAVDRLNTIRDGFSLDKDVVLKTALVLCDFKDIAFKVDNFNKANMTKIETDWDKIVAALEMAVELVASFGFNRDTLTSNNALIPVAYYLLKAGLPKNFCLAKEYYDDREQIRKWLILSLVKRVFGGKPDNVLTPLRDILNKNNVAFPLAEIKTKFKGTNKSLDFTTDEIENLLESRYGQPYTFSLLSLLYPTLDFRNHFHVDHMHPRAAFTRAKLLKEGIKDDEIPNYMWNCDALPNLQLLEGVPNQQKSDTGFEAWFNATVAQKGQQAIADYREKHFVPNIGFSLLEFAKFFDQRKSLMRDALKKLLGVS
jgi:uncharacterized protein with ParB-like and HNH nuclease domain